ncbi:LysR family transcriptional regulator [Acerihabitans sp. TG2]|uniref:LysR family transcriptional regulator n=1 Tax=Acerihabitans sp. TG2 TaxID=3096008 RepID=UPI002B22F6D7|nr:LysR family transcriptional regulator [Acerihabitans sp. TG2]MEA9390162.1 LysR family transcriptional regulator [Acerihabitans sp. TG2]
MSPFSRFAVYFAEVAKSGSLRKASEKLHVSASAINRQILQAETAFGTPLFERLPEGLRMTTAGELLYANILRWQREFRITQQQFDEIQGLKRGEVSVAIVQALSEGCVANAFSDIAKMHHWLRLELSVDDSQTISQRIRQSEIDFGLLLDPVGQAGLNVIAFAELEMGVIMPPDAPLARQTQISLGELSSERHIIPGEPLMVHDRVKMLYRQYDFSPENRITCNDIRLIKSLVRQGSGVCILSLLDVLEEVKNNQLRFVPLKNHHLRPLTLALCTAPSRQLSRAAQMTIQKMTEVIESLAGFR